MELSRFRLGARVVLQGHVLNWPWRSSVQRRRVRGSVTAQAVCDYLDRYVPEFSDVPEDMAVGGGPGPERIFSMWLQGESQAPPVVQACWRSMRANSAHELVILDGRSVFDWIDLPSHVVDKWRRGLIRPAHFADLCRVELLYAYGGFWLDATDFIGAELPEWMLDQDFFVYMAGETLRGSYSFIQNCFIRGRRGAYLLKAWREAMSVYWRHEDSTVDYFVHQLLFRKVVECNAKAAVLFGSMPRLVQDPTHELWFGNASRPFDADVFERIVSSAAFQKTEYKSSDARNPVPGSFADVMMKMYL